MSLLINHTTCAERMGFDMKDLNKLRSEFEAWVLQESPQIEWEINQKTDGEYDSAALSWAWAAWQEKAKAQAVPEGHLILPKTPSYEMWSGIARHLGRYMQMHDRYCPKTLKKYFDRFIGDIPDWLNKEVKDWDSDHAFATADLPAFIYMSMIEASESGAEG